MAVDEIAKQAGINPAIADSYIKGYHDSEARKTAPVAALDVDPRDAFEAVFPIPPYAERCGAGYYCTAYSAWNVQDFIQKWHGWDACRAAMLKGGPVTAATVTGTGEVAHHCNSAT